MDISRKVFQKQNSPEKIRKDFYSEVTRSTGFTESHCRELLVDAFGERFDSSRIPEYKQLLNEHADDERTKAAVEQMRQNLRNRMQVVTPDSCWCGKGVRMVDRKWRWTCSLGGHRHYLADVAAKAANISPEVMLARIEALDNEAQEVITVQ